jgi:GT2 family glycosyltransferase
MRFSIIVVTLNAGDELFNTVESCMNQTFTDREIKATLDRIRKGE